MTVERTHRWRHAFALILVTGLVGVYTERSLLLLASGIGVVYTAYPLLTPEPTIDLALTRTVSDETPDHGDPVTVTVTVTNSGSRTITDLRLIDGVPSLLAVDEGSARHTATLGPDVSTTFRYTITAKHGVHRFESATAIVHDISGSTRIRTNIETGPDTPTDTLDCSVEIHSASLCRQTEQYTAPVRAGRSGTGIEFYQTRAYQRGDPANRIDWRRFARTGELTTVEFQAERSSSVVLCLDARARSVRNTQPNEPHAVAYSVAAASELLSRFRAHGRRVGIAVFGREFAWLAPDTGHSHHERAVQLLRTHRRATTQTDGQRDTANHSDQLRTCLRQSGTTGEVVLFTPLLDEFGVTVAQQLDASGHAVTVISPDSSTGDTLGGELVRIERRNRVQSLQQSQIPVCDWMPGEPIVWTALERKTSVK